MFAKCPAGRPGTADEVANVAELLMSDKGAFITGSTFLMDELVPKLGTSNFSPIWGEVTISQALAASKQQELFFFS